VDEEINERPVFDSAAQPRMVSVLFNLYYSSTIMEIDMHSCVLFLLLPKKAHWQNVL